jgi:hypothetical protein
MSLQCLLNAVGVLGLDMSGLPTPQELVDKPFKINKSSQASSWH